MPVDHSVLIEQLEAWALDLERARRAISAERQAVMGRLIKEIRQVAADLTREDAEARG